MFTLFIGLVQATHEALFVAFVSETVFVLLPRGRVVCNIDFAILAVVLLLGHPELAHIGFWTELKMWRGVDGRMFVRVGAQARMIMSG
jgi:hypothetical protein